MISSWRFPFAMVLLASLAACSHTASETRDAALKGQAALPQIPSAWNSDPSQQRPIKAGWVKALNDPILTNLVKEAQKANPDLRALQATVAQSRALVRQSRSQLYPFLGLEAGASTSGIVDGGPSSEEFSLGVAASWEADIWGRIEANVTQAQAGLAATEADYQFSKLTLAAAVAQAYFAIIEAREQEQIASDLVAVLKEVDRIANVRLKEGYATARDSALTLTDLENAREQSILTSQSKRDAMRALEVLLGRYPSADLKISISFPELPASPPAGLPSQLLERRPDIVAAERRIAASIAGVNQKKAAQLPQFTLSSSLGGASDELDNVLDPANVIWTLATNLLTPLFDAGRLNAEVDEAKAVQDQVIANYAATALNAFKEVETALDRNLSERQRARALSGASAASQRALHIARLRYREGEEDLLDVLTIQQSAFQARSALVSIERIKLENYVQLSLALGGHWLSNAD